MEKNIKELNSSQRTALRKSVKAVMYNKINEGEYKDWFSITELVPPKGVFMSIWTKEQSKDLDKRFEDVKTELRSEMNDMESRLNTRIDNVEHTMINLFKLNGFKTE